MFDDIQALEREVEEFKNNILASKELVSGIDKMIKAMDNQREIYGTAYQDILNKLNDYANTQKNEAEDRLVKLEKNNEITINNAVEKLVSIQKEHIIKIDEIEKKLKNSEEELANKYQQFIMKFESTNIDQIYSSVQDLKKSMNFKFTILLSSIIFSLVLSIVILLLK